MNYIGTQPPNSNASGTPGASLARYLAFRRFAPRFDLPEPARLDQGLRVRVEPRQPAARLKLGPLTTDRFVRVYTDRITYAVREAIGTNSRYDPAAGWRHDPKPGFHWSFPIRDTGDTDSLRGVVGLPSDADPALLTILEENPALVMQTELILSARVFQQCRFDPHVARLSASLLLDDRGIERHKSGGHKKELLEKQRRALQFLTSLRVVADYWTAAAGRTRTLDGVLWKVPEDDREALWSPQSRSGVFTVGRGTPFFRPSWAARNDFAKPVRAALLGLTRQKAAVLLGGYLATVGPMNGYRPKVFNVKTLTGAAGLAGSYTKNPKELRELLEEALDVLQVAVVIGSWKYADREQVRISWPPGIKAVPDWKDEGRGRGA